MGDSIKDYFIRPQRQTYYSFDLGPTILFVAGRRWLRNDFQVTNANGHKLSVSFYSCEQQGFQNCLAYLHTHNGSRLEGVPILEELLALPINVCLFDFAGYGNSQGSTVSLGWKEASDIHCILEYLKEEMGQKKFILWGRSMGAVAGLLYLASRNENEVIGGIFDSPFHSLQKLTLQLGSRSSNLPEVLLMPLIFLLKSSLKEDIDFSELELKEKVEAIKVPAVFLASQLDNFVHYSHSQLLYKHYGGAKELIYIEKDHNQLRKTQDLSPVYAFIKRLNTQNPKGWQTVLANHLAYAKKIYGR